MPKLKDTTKLLGRYTEYREQSPEWFRQRLLVFVPEREGESARWSNGIDDALATVVQVTESPTVPDDSRIFAPMTHFVTRMQTGSGENLTRLRIQKVIRKYSQDIGVSFEPRVHETVCGESKRNGFFTGNALFSPATTVEIPRGTVSVFLFGPRDRAGKRRSWTCKIEYDNKGRNTPAGMYLGQDRICFGTSDVMPVNLRFDEQQGGEDDDKEEVWQRLQTLFKKRAVCMLLPPDGRARGEAVNVVYADLCEDAVAAMNAVGSISGTGHSVISLLKQGETTLEFAPSAPIDPAHGYAELDVSHGLLTASAVQDGYSTIMRVAPNTAYSRLRSVSDQLRYGRLEILGVIVPRPSINEQTREVFVGFSAEYQLLGDMLSGQSQVIGLRRRFLNREVVLFADDDGTVSLVADQLSDQIPVHPGLHHAIHLISGKSNFPTLSGIPGIERLLTEEIQTLPENQFALLTQRTGSLNLGWVGVPLPHTAAAGIESPDARVVMSRSGVGDAIQNVCLDWLDTAIKIVARNRAGKYELMGYGEYWDTTIKSLVPMLSSPQSFRLLEKKGRKKGSEMLLHFVDQKRDIAPASPLTSGTFLRVGPLIVRYSHGGARDD